MPDLDGDDLWGDSGLDNSNVVCQGQTTEPPHGDIKSEFHRYPLLPAVFDELDVFFEAKSACVADNSMENKIRLCSAYELAFTSIKHEMHAGRISEGDFWHLKALLQEESAV